MLSLCYPVFPAYQRRWQDLIWTLGSLCITDTSSIYISLATVSRMKEAPHISFLLWPSSLSKLILCSYILSKSLQSGIFYRLSWQQVCSGMWWQSFGKFFRPCFHCLCLTTIIRTVKQHSQEGQSSAFVTNKGWWLLGLLSSRGCPIISGSFLSLWNLSCGLCFAVSSYC